MYKIKNDQCPLIVTELFEHRNEKHNDIRNNAHVTVYDGSESISFLGPKIWNILLFALKRELKNGRLKIAHVGFARLIFKISVLFRKISSEGKEQKISRETEVHGFMRF